MTSSRSSSSDNRRNPLGLIAFVVGVLVLIVAAGLTLGQIGLIGSADPSLIQSYGIAVSFIRGILGLGATVLGVIALLSRHTSRPLAAAGTALGASLLFTALTGALYPLVASLASR